MADLKSGLIKDHDISVILEDPSSYIECAEHFSWEYFFERLLIDSTVDTLFQYAKKELNPIYFVKSNADKIIMEIYVSR